MDKISEALNDLQMGKAEDKKLPSWGFLEFFRKGSAGRAVFQEFIVPFLSLDDLVNGSCTCRQMNAMCRTFTVGDVLEMRSMDHISRDHKIGLGKLVMGFVSPNYNSKKKHQRLVHTTTESFQARIYHPAVAPDMELAMAAYFNKHGIEFDGGMNDFNWDASNDPKTPILVKALYGRQPHLTDVTIILRYLLMRQGNQKLSLKRPPNGPRYWYNYLFGDPFYKKTKELFIVIRREGLEGYQKAIFMEDQRFKMRLRATRDGASELAALKQWEQETLAARFVA